MLTHDVLDESFELACFHNRLWDRWLLLAYWDAWVHMFYAPIRERILALWAASQAPATDDASTRSADSDHEDVPDTDDGWEEL